MTPLLIRAARAEVLSGGAVLVVGAALNGCFLNALAECPPENQNLADGGTANGINPNNVLATLYGDHLASLTWLRLNQSTTMHLDIEPAGTVTVSYDCEGHLGEFQVSVSADVTTDDGLINVTQNTEVAIDASGHVSTDPQWSWNNLSVDPFVAAGVVDSSLPEDALVVTLAIATQNLKPLDGSVQMSVSAPVPPTTIGTFHFR